MIENEVYLPTDINDEYGIWNTLIFNALKQRVTYLDDFEGKHRYL